MFSVVFGFMAYMLLLTKWEWMYLRTDVLRGAGVGRGDCCRTWSSCGLGFAICFC